MIWGLLLYLFNLFKNVRPVIKIACYCEFRKKGEMKKFLGKPDQQYLGLFCLN